MLWILMKVFLRQWGARPYSSWTKMLVFLPQIQYLNMLSPDLLWTSPVLSAIAIIIILPGLGAWSLRDRLEAGAVWAAEDAREVLAAGGGAAGALWQPWYAASVGVGSSHSEHASGDTFRPLIHNKYWDHGNNLEVILKIGWDSGTPQRSFLYSVLEPLQDE